MMFLASCVGVYTIGSWEGEGEEGKGEEGKGEDDKSFLGRVYCLLSSMSHVESMHTKQTKTTVCYSAIEFRSMFRQ